MSNITKMFAGPVTAIKTFVEEHPLLTGAMLEIKDIEKLHLDFCRLSQQYGDVFSMYLGNQLFVVLNSHEAIKEAFVTKGVDFAGRPDSPGLRLMKFKDQIFTATYDEEWKDNKKFAVQALRTSGFGSKAAEGKIMNGVKGMVKYLQEKDGKPFILGYKDFAKMTSQIATSILFSKNYDWEDPELSEFLDVLSQVPDTFSTAMTLDFIVASIPEWAAKLLFRSQIKKGASAIHEGRRLIENCIAEHRSTFDKNNIRDFLDVYINAQSQRGFDEFTFANTVLVFIPDAVSSIAVILHWSIYYLAMDPEVQTKAQEEIDEVVGTSRQVSLNDKDSLPYLEAIFIEITRISSLIPVGAAHTALVDTMFRGYNIPKKNCQIFANIYAAHMNPKHFQEPEKFDPSRHLEADKFILKHDHVIPFSMGRRMCPGEQMTKVEVFLALGNLLQQFTFKFPEGEPIPPRDDFISHFISTHNDFKIRAVPRN